MNQSTKLWMAALRWTLGVVVLIESCLFVFSASGLHAVEKTGMPHWIRPVLGGAEIIAAILFLVPPTSAAGGYLLLIVFFFAAAIHVLHGEYNIGGLIVYAVAVMACVKYRGEEAVEGSR